MKKIFVLLLSAAMLLTAGGCGASAADSGDNKTIKIAIMDTEYVFSADDSYINGINMAIEDLNAP